MDGQSQHFFFLWKKITLVHLLWSPQRSSCLTAAIRQHWSGPRSFGKPGRSSSTFPLVIPQQVTYSSCFWLRKSECHITAHLDPVLRYFFFSSFPIIASASSRSQRLGSLRASARCYSSLHHQLVSRGPRWEIAGYHGNAVRVRRNTGQG